MNALGYGLQDHDNACDNSDTIKLNYCKSVLFGIVHRLSDCNCLVDIYNNCNQNEEGLR